MNTYDLRYETPSVQDYIDIRLRAGLSRKSDEAAEIGLKNSLCTVVIYFEGEPIGIGRVIGDGGCFFTIVDMAVVPEHQKKGVGDMIMQALMGYIRENAPATAYISLMAHHGTPKFYARYGFKIATLPDAAGMYQYIS